MALCWTDLDTKVRARPSKALRTQNSLARERPGTAATLASAWVATVPGTYPTPEAGTRTQYVLYVGPWGQAALRLRYVHNAGGWYA